MYRKLVVIISGLEAAEALRLEDQKTNDEEKSGIFLKSTDDTASASWKSPTLDANAFQVVRLDKGLNEIENGSPEISQPEKCVKWLGGEPSYSQVIQTAFGFQHRSVAVT